MAAVTARLPRGRLPLGMYSAGAAPVDDCEGDGEVVEPEPPLSRAVRLGSSTKLPVT